MATPGQWIPPLPGGWEARWDPTQRAYFFIDHRTKATTWQDPRFHQPPQQQAHHAAAQSLNTQNLHTAGGQGQNVAMTTMFKQFGTTTTRDSGSSDDDEWENPEDFDKLFASSSDEKKVDVTKLHEIKQSFPSASEDLIRSLLEKHSNSVVKTTNELFSKGYKREAVSHPPPRKVDMAERLKAMFPTANKELVDDMLVACNNDEKKARENLESMGYNAQFPATHRNASAKGGRTASPARAPSPRRSPSPAKPKISESEKENLVRKFQKLHKNSERSVIEMALKVCDYDEERAKQLFERMNTGADSSPPPTSRPSTSRTRSPSPTPVIEPASLEPVTLFDDRPGHSNSVVKTTNELFSKGYKREAVSHPPPRKVDMAERLKAMFPTANKELVDDMLVACNNDEKKARENLESMGYNAQFPATHRNASAKGGRTASPARAPSPRRSPSPAKPKISESEKENLVRKFQKLHKNSERSVIEMALKVCDYDEERAKQLFERMNTGADSSPPPTSRPSTSRTRSPSPTPVIEPASLEPVTLFDDRPGTSTSTARTSASRGSTPGIRKSSDSASRPSTGKSSSRTPSPKKSTSTTSSHHAQQHRAKQVTHRNQGGSVVSRQPQPRQTYTSQYRTEAKGPDPSLRMGPNKLLLLTEYTLAKGPNPELRQGADPSRVQGSQGAMGPDRSLHCGPNFNNRSGPSTENLLVTAI